MTRHELTHIHFTSVSHIDGSTAETTLRHQDFTRAMNAETSPFVPNHFSLSIFALIFSKEIKQSVRAQLNQLKRAGKKLLLGLQALT